MFLQGSQSSFHHIFPLRQFVPPILLQGSQPTTNTFICKPSVCPLYLCHILKLHRWDIYTSSVQLFLIRKKKVLHHRKPSRFSSMSSLRHFMILALHHRKPSRLSTLFKNLKHINTPHGARDCRAIVLIWTHLTCSITQHADLVNLYNSSHLKQDAPAKHKSILKDVTQIAGRKPTMWIVAGCKHNFLKKFVDCFICEHSKSVLIHYMC